MMVGAAGPYPPSPTPTNKRIVNRSANVPTIPEAAVATLHKITLVPMISQRDVRAASQPKIGAEIM